LTIAGGANPTATFDLTDNKLVLDYTGATSPAPTVRSQLRAARNTGNWDGPGITSSSAGADGQKRTAIGWAEASALLGLADPNTATWAGQTVDATSVLLKYTYYGDANLDGKVNADDFALIDRGVARYQAGTIPANGAGWTDGDFDYNGTVDPADY